MNFALAGNPNCGKTTLFNKLTGASARVGNWPGVTVDRKEGFYKGKNAAAPRIGIIDLPGIYSLSPYTPEEMIARDYLLGGQVDLIINIVDATNLERNLYLTTQLLEMDVPIVVALNMTDLAAKSGLKIDADALARALGVPVVPICALHGSALAQLMKTACQTARAKRKGCSVLADSEFGPALAKAEALLDNEGMANAVFHAVKLLEDDSAENARFPQAVRAKIDQIRASIALPKEFEGDGEAAAANARYNQIEKRFAPLVKRAKSAYAPTRSDKLDRVLTSRLFGLPIFFALMFLAFHLIFGEDLFYLSAFGLEPVLSPGVWLLEEMGALTEWITGLAAAGLTALGASEWVHALFVDGVFAGLGAVLSFLPQILLLFLFLSLMEDSGYMARAAFLMDRVLRKFGLSGKAFMPLLMCFGCLVPAMMGSRTLENDRERRLMIMLAPFFSCGAKLPIWAMFGMAIFPEHADLAVFGIYVLGILTAIVAAIILKCTILRGEAAPFVMELPPYHMPLARNVLRNLWEKLKGFLLRASTIIAGATVVIWFLSSFSFGLSMVEANSQESILGAVGTFLQPVFEPLGWASGDMGWKAIVAALTGLIAKEMVVSTMGVLYNPDIEGDALEDDAASSALAAALVGVFSPVAAVSFMAFNLLSVPCMAAVATAHAEMRSAKWTWLTIGFWIATAWIVSFLIYQIGSLIWS